MFQRAKLFVTVFILFILYCSCKAEGNWNKFTGALADISCQFKSECCRAPFVRSADAVYNELKRTLKSDFFGQHIAVQTVLNSLDAHLNDDNPKKPLVLSFHGWAGSGKTYLAELIIKAIFEKGVQSRYVRMYTASHHFPDKDRVPEYKEKLKTEIKETLLGCERAVIIFDEVDVTPPTLYDGLVGLLDHFPYESEVNHKKAIFIFMSNIGSNAITYAAMTTWKDGRNRNDLSFEDFHEAVSKESFNAQNTGFSKTRIIERVLVDFFVPFLPMERQHVIQCAQAEIRRQRADVSAESVADRMTYWPADLKLYSQTGCKRVEALVKYYKSANKFKDEL